MTDTQAAPKKLFREPAQTESVKCLSCGGPISLRSFGAKQRVVCPHCGSTLAPEDSGALALLEAAARKHQESVLPLHARGTLDGVEWEIIGICWRHCVVDGIAYPWQEFLLFNPYRGFRWLIHSLTDHHWSLGQDLGGAPQILAKGHHSVRYGKTKYKHFQGATAVVTYVEGEFTWEVHVGDKADINDFVAPPRGLSIEQSAGPDGVELNFTADRWLPAKEVWAAFKQPGKPPTPRGVAATQPNHWWAMQRSLWLSCLVFLVAWWVLSGMIARNRPGTLAFAQANISFDEPFSKEITIGNEGDRTALEITFSADPLEQSWAYADIMLVNLATEEATGLGAEVEWYSGYDGGESWSEGSRVTTVTVGGVPGGQYLLQIHPQRDTTNLPSSSTSDLGLSIPSYSLSGVGRSPTTYDIRIVQDVYLTRYSVLAFCIITLFPLLSLILGRSFEKRRWHNSDYS